MSESKIKITDFIVDPGLTFEIRGAIFATRNELKAGWSEEIYHKGLVLELESRGLDIVSKPRCSLTHRNVEIHTFEPDIIVNNEVILELKVLGYKKKFAGPHYFQLLNYLKFFEKPLGMLVDFTPAITQIKRVRLDAIMPNVVEDFDAFQDKVLSNERHQLWKIISCVRDIAERYSIGYSDVLYKRILQIEFEYRGFDCLYPINAPVLWKGQQIGQDNLQLLCVNNTCLVHVRSLLYHPTVQDFTSVNTYLNSLGLKFGLVVNFGRKEIQIRSVNSD